MCVCSLFEHILVFPWDYGELLLLTSSLLCGGELFTVFITNEGFYKQTLSIYNVNRQKAKKDGKNI